MASSSTTHTPEVRPSRNGEGSVGRITPWPTRKHTPYGKTPTSRRIQPRKRAVPPEEDVSLENNVATLKGLCGCTWRVYKVTPLYKFSHKAADLMRYSKQLAAFIATEVRQGMAIGIEEEKPNKVALEVQPGLRLHEDGAEAVRISMNAKSKTGVPGQTQEVLTAILLSCLDEPAHASLLPEFTLLPVMLVRGTVGLTGHLQTWLQRTFDCSLSLLHFSHYHLSWMAAMFSGHLPEKSAKRVSLQYKIPPEVEGINKITLDIHPTHCKTLWDNIHDGSSDEFKEEEVQQFCASLESHFDYYFKMNLKGLQLGLVGNSLCLVGEEGRLKLFCQERVPSVLKYVTDIATEQLLTS